jgi:hypothetical protein
MQPTCLREAKASLRRRQANRCDAGRKKDGFVQEGWRKRGANDYDHEHGAERARQGARNAGQPQPVSDAGEPNVFDWSRSQVMTDAIGGEQSALF